MPQVINTVTKASPTDNYAVVYDTDLLGSYRIVADITARDGIVSNQRKQNMLVFVISTLNYYSLQSDLLTWDNLGTSLGGSAIFIETTRVALQAQITGSTLSKGTQYAITDFLDKTTTDTNSRVIVTATSTNTISQTGFWKRLTQNKAYGAFTLSGTSGNVSQISVGVTNLMTATVNYTTSPINTANLIATNINANSGVSGYRCIVCTGSTLGGVTEQVPALVIEKVLAGVDTGTVVVTATLTIGSVTNMTMGLAQVEQTLDISYDITANRIIACYDSQYDNRMVYTTTQISTLGYNPIVNWRWGHGTFRSWLILGVSYRDFFDFPPTSGANIIEQQNTLTEGGIDRVVIRRTNPASLSLSFNSSLTLTSSNLMGETVINNNKIKISLTTTTNNSLGLTITNNIGSNINGQVNGIFCPNARFLNAFTYVINANDVTRLAMSGGYYGGADFSKNFGNNIQTGNAVTRYTGTLTITGNLMGTRSISMPTAPNSVTFVDCNLIFKNNDVTLADSDIAFGILRAGSGKNYTVTNNVFKGISTLTGINIALTTEDIFINNVEFNGGLTLNGGGMSTPFIIQDTTFDGLVSIPSITASSTVNIQNSKFIGNTAIQGESFSCQGTTFTNLVILSFFSFLATNCSFTQNIAFTSLPTADYNFSNCVASNSTFEIVDVGGNILFECVNSTFDTATIRVSNGATNFYLLDSSIIKTVIDISSDPSSASYIIENFNVNNKRGFYYKQFTFDGSSGFGLVNTQGVVIDNLFGQNTGVLFVITKSTIANISGLTSGVGASLSLGSLAGGVINYIPVTLESTLSSNFIISNEPVGVANESVKYSTNLSVTGDTISAGTVDIYVEFIIAP